MLVLDLFLRRVVLIVFSGSGTVSIATRPIFLLIGTLFFRLIFVTIGYAASVYYVFDREFDRPTLRASRLSLTRVQSTRRRPVWAEAVYFCGLVICWGMSVVSEVKRSRLRKRKMGRPSAAIDMVPLPEKPKRPPLISARRTTTRRRSTRPR